MSIRVHLEAGIGNRLFQYASLKGLAKRYNFNFEVYSAEFSQEHNTKYDWFNKDVLHVDADQSKWNQLLASTPDQIWYQPSDEHIGYHEDKIDKDMICNKVVKGYFQSDLYFRHIKDEIRKDLKPPSYVTDWIQKYLQEISIDINNNNLCVIHFRLGMLVVMYHKHFINLTEYYKRCMSQLKDDDPIIIICEDPQGIPIVYPEVFKILQQRKAPVYIAPSNVPICEAFHLYLMSYAKTVIAANSTFSWWGAWLNPRDDKVVFIPSRFINTSNHGIDMEGAIVVDVP